MHVHGGNVENSRFMAGDFTVGLGIHSKLRNIYKCKNTEQNEKDINFKMNGNIHKFTSRVLSKKTNLSSLVRLPVILLNLRSA